METAKIKIKKIKPYKLAYIEHVGDYGNIPFDKYVSQLYGWAKEKRIRPGFRPLGIYYDNPEHTPPEKCRSEIGIPIHGAPESGGNIKIKDMPPMEVATIKHAGPAKEYPKTYVALNE
jgi:AraC family transcriptional regulator